MSEIKQLNFFSSEKWQDPNIFNLSDTHVKMFMEDQRLVPVPAKESEYYYMFIMVSVKLSLAIAELKRHNIPFSKRPVTFTEDRFEEVLNEMCFLKRRNKEVVPIDRHRSLEKQFHHVSQQLFDLRERTMELEEKVRVSEDALSGIGTESFVSFNIKKTFESKGTQTTTVLRRSNSEIIPSGPLLKTNKPAEARAIMSNIKSILKLNSPKKEDSSEKIKDHNPEEIDVPDIQTDVNVDIIKSTVKIERETKQQLKSHSSTSEKSNEKPETVKSESKSELDDPGKVRNRWVFPKTEDVLTKTSEIKSPTTLLNEELSRIAKEVNEIKDGELDHLKFVFHKNNIGKFNVSSVWAALKAVSLMFLLLNCKMTVAKNVIDILVSDNYLAKAVHDKIRTTPSFIMRMQAMITMLSDLAKRLFETHPNGRKVLLDFG